MARHANGLLLKEKRQLTEHVISVVREGCSSCAGGRYFVTNACRACVARPCEMGCPKHAISVRGGQSHIDHDLCIDCGLCQKVCPYHAIIRTPIPCEEACPVNAIGKDKHDKGAIDHEKCIACGQCMTSCPFGAILERSQFLEILQALANKKPLIAMVAPAIVGQFKGSLGQIAKALLTLGFSDVIEVAYGADMTSHHEGEEFFERREKGDKLMTSSCCPAYTALVQKKFPELASFVSSTKSPMYYTSQFIKEKIDNVTTVFIGPCLAKRVEAKADPYTDFVLTFEELDALFAAKSICPTDCEEAKLNWRPSSQGQGFAATCGVTEAVLHEIDNQIKLNTAFIDGLDKKAIKKLELYLKGSIPCDFLEVMACQGGCANGPCVIGRPEVTRQAIKQLIESKI